MTTFREEPAIARYFVKPITVQVPGIPAGSPATVRMRMWNTSAGSYEAAINSGLWWGESNDVTVPQLGGIPPGGGPPIPDALLAGLQSFMSVPEPSTPSIALMGAAFLMARRRTSSHRKTLAKIDPQSL